MTNHGGKRENAGRKLEKGVKGKRVQFYIYPHEKELIKEFIKSLRA